MRYWITTHWPPREDDPDAAPFGVWIPDGREAAGNDLGPGDVVFIYQCQSGRTEVRTRPDGARDRIRSIRGREGVIAIVRVEDRLRRLDDVERTDYADGSQIWWRWHAPTTLLSQSGFIPRPQVNTALGYDPTWNMRGFGDQHSGLKRISEVQFRALTDLFRGHRPNILPPPAPAPSPGGGTGSGWGGEGGGEESEAHRRLKEYVAARPEAALGERGLRHLGTEYRFVTQDQADVVLEDQVNRIIGVEIEVSVADNQPAGMLQAIKYRYMLEPITNVTPGDSRAFLVAYVISGGMVDRCRAYGVEPFVVSKVEVDAWATR